jgi:hypothetical protein
MKLNFAMIVALLTSFAAAPAFADWDMPSASSIGSTVASSVSNLTSQPSVQTIYSDISGLATSGFDLNSLSSLVNDATAGDATGLQQQSEYTANTTDITGSQAVSTLPECRTSTLSVAVDPANPDALPSCALSSLASMSVVNKGATGIYGDAGRNGRPDMRPIAIIDF